MAVDRKKDGDKGGNGRPSKPPPTRKGNKTRVRKSRAKK
tara:strand:- start:1610 stop:1726 length:117 start_codon:yes stop_codon:yes gene_type:complete